MTAVPLADRHILVNSSASGGIKRPGCWLTYSTFYGPGKTLNDRAFIISIVLDAGTLAQYKGVRIVIGYDEGDLELDRAGVEDCFDASQCGITSRGPYRQRLSDLRHNLISSPASAGRASAADSLPVLPIVLQMVSVYDPQYHKFEFIPQTSSSSPSTDLHIIYDRAVRCSARISGVYLLFQSTHSVRGSRKPGVVQCAIPRSLGVLVHHIRVLPVERSRPFSFQLSERIIRLVAEYVIDSKDNGWRTDLLSLARISRAWASVPRLYFEHLGRESDRDPANAVAVARSLCMKPEYGKFVLGIGLSDFKRCDEGDEACHEACSLAIATILNHMPNVSHMGISFTHSSSRADLLGALSRLEHVRSFSMLGHQSANDITIRELQKCLPGWKNLHSLMLSDWQSDLQSDFPRFASAGKAANKELASLTLFKGQLTGSQLICFTSSSFSSLRHVSMQDVSGIKNSDFLTFLMQVSPTLTDLHLHRVEIDRGDGEEYALDSAIPHLVNVSRVYVIGDLLSERAIARRRETQWIGDQQTSRYLVISIDRAPGVSLENLAGAINVTAWNTIRLLNCFRASTRNSSAFAEARATAEGRGIKFVCS